MFKISRDDLELRKQSRVPIGSYFYGDLISKSRSLRVQRIYRWPSGENLRLSISSLPRCAPRSFHYFVSGSAETSLLLEKCFNQLAGERVCSRRSLGGTRCSWFVLKYSWNQNALTETSSKVLFTTPSLGYGRLLFWKFVFEALDTKMSASQRKFTGDNWRAPWAYVGLVAFVCVASLITVAKGRRFTWACWVDSALGGQ